jgi:DNA polymerase-3 subunit alpha
LEIQDHGLEEQRFLNTKLTEWSQRYAISCIVTNNTYYNSEADADLHDTYLCVVPLEYKDTPIGQGRGFRFGMRSQRHHLCSGQEMAQRFASHPDWLRNTLELADSMESYTLQRNVLLPRFEIPQGFVDENAYLRHLTLEGAGKRYDTVGPELLERIDFELQTIAHTGYPGYFLIVQDLTTAARQMGVTVGPGRGSAAGSVVAYCTGITDVDPIRYDLLFERFLNPDRVSMPDIDIDFDDRGREKVMRYVMDKYGQRQVAQIATYHSMAAKSAIRSIGRVMGMQPFETDALAKLFPEDLNRAEYYKKSPLRKLLLNPNEGSRHLDQLQAEDQRKAKQLLELVKKGGVEAKVLQQSALLEGSFKNSGTHACGVVITPGDLTDYVPVKHAPDGQISLVTQFDNEVAEAAGLLKMDFLGLNTLTIINDAVELVRAIDPELPDPVDFPLDDQRTYELFQRGETVGIFQYESSGMQKYLKELKPDKIEDLIAMNALYRPGPLAYIPNFIQRKHGREPIIYDLADMEELLSETYGITVYQEQVMLLSQKLAGFSKGKADELRKAMGKKIPEKLAKLKPQFLEGCRERGHDETVAFKVWKDWEAFAEYAFNKSHSTCYALVAFRTAYLKAHFPAQFMAAVLSNHMSDITKVAFFLEECRRMGLQVLGPDLNESLFRFSVNASGQIRFGLGAIKGVGEGAVENIIQQRLEGGSYSSLFDFCKRIDLRQANKKTMEALAQAGALDRLDGIQGNRRLLLDAEAGGGSHLLEKAMRFGQQFRELSLKSQTSLFGSEGMVDVQEPFFGQIEPWASLEMLRMEKEVVGLYITAHPLDAYALECKFLGTISLTKLDERPGMDIQIAVLVVEVQYFRDSKNQEVLAFAVEDKDSSRKFRLRGDQAMKFKHLMDPGTALLISGRWEYFTGKDGQQAGFFRFNNIELMSEIRDKRFRMLTLQMSLPSLNTAYNAALEEILLAHPGRLALKVELWVPEDQRSVTMDSGRIRVAPDETLFAALDRLEIGYSLQ